jgi:hypothetical protein
LLTATVTNTRYWAACKDEIARILKLGGKALCFGWNTMGVCMSRGFEMTRVLMVPHGGSRHDTICTVEIKTQSVLFGNAPIQDRPGMVSRRLIQKAPMPRPRKKRRRIPAVHPVGPV